MPDAPYPISGTVKYGPRQGYAERESTVDTGVGSETVNLQLDAGTSTKADMTVTIEDVTTGESVTGVTNASGQYSIDIANLTSGYTNGDTLLIWCQDISATDTLSSSDSVASQLPGAHGRFTRVVSPGRLGKEHTEVYPIPVNVMNFSVNAENPSYAATYSSGLIATETITFTVDGSQKSYRKTYTWSSGTLTAETAWVEV
jgi:hypothetical protein